MAILKDLIVHGSSRFLNKIYANELEVSAFEAESAIIKKLTAKDSILGNATVVGLLDVQGQLHTNTWTNSNIATIDGCFYITPTLSSDSGKISFSSTTVASLTGSYSAVTSLYIGDSSSGSTVQWTKDSKVLLTGEVEVNGQWLPLGTLLGTLSANASTSSIGLTGLTDNRHNPSSIITDIRNAVSNTSLNYRNLKISLYQRRDGTDSKPLGIYMTAMGANGKTFIDIYGGVNATTTAGSSGGFADPNLRIGNLSGLGAVEGTTPTGWGIYTTNGYFKGVIVSSAGKIGGFDIGTSSIKNTKTSYSETTNNGVWVGTDGIGLGKGLFYVTNAGALTAKSGSIAGWSFNTTSLYKTNATPGYNTSTMVISTGTASTNNIGGGGTASKTWMISAGTGFGVTTAGALYCNNAHISGEITATSGTIGGASITDGVLLVKDANISGKISASHIDVSSITIGSLSGADNYALKDDVPTTVAELTDSGSYLTTSVASNTYATQTNLNNEINARKAVYGTSSTDAGTATKAVTCSNFALYTGASVTVTFSKTNTSSAPQLNVNSTGAKPIKSYTGANLTEGEYKWAAGATITFTYDGTNWRMQDGGALQAKIDAASSASTASSQAGVATQQATNATNAKTAAESAKTAAESAKTAAQSAKTAAETARGAAETASSQASSAKNTAVSAKNDAVSAKTDAETAKGQAQTAAGNASQSATNAANSATAAAEVMGGFTILWNYSAFTSQDNGEGYLCAFDPTTGTKSDANGWVKWNGVKRTITKQMINPNTVLPYNIPIYVVCRLSSATATTGTNYMVWYNSGWKYAVMPTPTAVGGSWTWVDNTDIILGKFVETASEAALTEYEIYNPPYTSKQITTNVVTAQSASASAASAAQTATTYITYVNATDGIKVHNVSDTSNYLQLNSSAISMYKGNTKIFNVDSDGYIIVGKVAASRRNVYITDSAVQIRNNTSVLAEYGDSIKLYKPTTTTVAVEISSSGASFTGSVSTGSKTASTTGKGTYIDSNGNIYVGNGSTNNFTVTDTGTITATGANLLTATIGNATNKITIGTGTSGHSSVRYGMTTLADTTNNGFYIGTDGIALGKGAFKVTAAGALTATSGSISGGIVTSGIDASNITVGTLSADRIEAGSIAIGKLDTSTQTKISNVVKQSIETIIGTQTSNTYSWTGTSSTLTTSDLVDGLTINYFLPYSVGGSQVSATYKRLSDNANVNTTGAVLNLTFSDGTSTGNLPIWYQGVGRLTSHYGYGSIIKMTYYKNIRMANAYEATGWWVDAQYNSDTYDNRIIYFTGKTGTKGIWAGSLFMEDANGTYQGICCASDGTITNASSGNGARTTATTKIANASGFKVGSTVYYTNTSYNANTNISGYAAVYSNMGNVFDSRYCMNTTLTANSLTTYKPWYLVGSINSSDGLFYLDSTWWTQTPNVTGKVYILGGGVYDSTTSNCRITLYEDNVWYIYNGSALVPYEKHASDQAAKTATKYITKIDDSGIKIQSYNDTNNTADINNYIQLNGDGLNIYKDGVSVAQYGENVRIGAAEDTHIEIDSNSIDIIDKNNNRNASFGEQIIIGDELSEKSYLSISTQGLKGYLNNQQIGFSIGHAYERHEDLDNTITFENPASQDENYYPSSFNYSNYVITSNINDLKYNLRLQIQATYTSINNQGQSQNSFLNKNCTIVLSNSDTEYSLIYPEKVLKEVFHNQPVYEIKNIIITINPITTIISIRGEGFNNIGFVSCQYMYSVIADYPAFTFGDRTSNTSEGEFSFAIGKSTIAAGQYSYAQGYYAKARGQYSHAEGSSTLAQAQCSHAQGYYTQAYTQYSHAEGYFSHATGQSSHGEGVYSVASGYASHAQNYMTIAKSSSQTAIGKCNIEDSDGTYAFIIGNGTQDNRSNALTVDWFGNLITSGGAAFNGNISITGSLDVTGSITRNNKSLFKKEDVTVTVTYAAGTIGSRGGAISLGTTVKSGYAYLGAYVFNNQSTATFSTVIGRNEDTGNAYLLVYRATGNAASNIQVKVRKIWVLNSLMST